MANQVPEEILQDPLLNKAIEQVRNVTFLDMC